LVPFAEGQHSIARPAAAVRKGDRGTERTP
jgi:hypothetical protein